MNLSNLFLSFFDTIGSLVCHQIPERTLWIGGHYLPVCARDIGAYLGFYIGYFMLHFRNRKATGPPNLWITLSMVIPLFVDGISQLFGYRTSTNDIRLITGLLFGTAIIPLLIYLLSILSSVRRLKVIRTILPIQTELDNLKNPWIGYKAFTIGLTVVVVLFFVIKAITGSNNTIFYWSVSSLIVISIITHIFILPILVLCSLTIMKRT